MNESNTSHESIKNFDLIKWKLRGFNSKDAKKWIKNGFTLTEAILLREQGREGFPENELNSE